MKKKILLIFLMLSTLMLFGCTVKEKHLEPAVEVAKSTEMLNENNSIESNGEQPETTKIPEVYQMTNYPIIGLTLTDFCQFSYKKEQTLMTDIVEKIGEPDGITEEKHPFYILYDGTKITFPVDENGYIYNPYITDSIGRIFVNRTSLRNTDNERLMTAEEIDTVKKGDYVFTGDGGLDASYYGVDKLLSISNFTVVPFYDSQDPMIKEEEMMSILGMPSGTSGSGMITSYYFLADGTIVTYFLVDDMFTPNDERGNVNHFVIDDLAGRSFA